jgi:hypothetical protein
VVNMPKEGTRKVFCWHVNLLGAPLHFQLKTKVCGKHAKRGYAKGVLLARKLTRCAASFSVENKSHCKACSTEISILRWHGTGCSDRAMLNFILIDKIDCTFVGFVVFVAAYSLLRSIRSYFNKVYNCVHGSVQC